MENMDNWQELSSATGRRQHASDNLNSVYGSLPAWNPDQAPPQRTSASRYTKLMSVAKFATVTLFFTLILLIPMLVFRWTVDEVDDTGLSDVDLLRKLYNDQWKNLGFWIGAWLLTTWLCACLFYAIACVFPYVFKYVASLVNPAHRRYWRIFRFMKWPVTFLGCTVGSFVAYAVMIPNNEELTSNYNYSILGNLTGNATADDGNSVDSGKDSLWSLEDVLSSILFVAVMWAVLYFVEKIIMLYITLHYNARSNFSQIDRLKRVISGLIHLYDGSVYLHPNNGADFQVEDVLIRRQTENTNIFHKARSGAEAMTSTLGHLLGGNERSHWMDPASSYAVVSRALNNPASAAALARRIWFSYTCKGYDVLRAEDIAAVLGPYRTQEAEEIFAMLDENDNGNIKLDEFVLTVVEIGKSRKDIYSGIHDINHAISTFDWIVFIILTVAIVAFILISYVPPIEQLRQYLSIILLGVAFAAGRIVYEFFAGAIFLFFKHAFDVGDTVHLYNMGETNFVNCVVKRMSLLYVVFERVDNGIEIQIPNDRLSLKRIENISRSGSNREEIILNIDFTTSFKDMQYLRNELLNFVTRKENSRDYQPRLQLNIKALDNLQHIQLQCAFWHKANWSNDALRAARSSKFLCELLCAVRKIPIGKPGGNGAKTGEEGKPSYVVMINEEAAAVKREAEKQLQLGKRIDHVKAPENEENKQPTGTEEGQEKKDDSDNAATQPVVAQPPPGPTPEETALQQFRSIPINDASANTSILRRRA